MLSTYQFQIIEYCDIPCLHILLDDHEAYIPVEDIQKAIGRLEIAPGLLEFPDDTTILQNEWVIGGKE